MRNDRNASPRSSGLSTAKQILLEKRLQGRSAVGHKPPGIARRSPGGQSPVSFAQQRLWFLHRLEPDSAAYNLPVALQLDGRLDVEALQRSLDEIVRRHEVLRTTFDSVDGQPLQRIAPESTVTLVHSNLSHFSEQCRDEELRRLIEDMAQRPFDLERGPLLRVGLARLAPERQVLLFTVHHSIFDGWSAGVLTREFAALYRVYSAGLPSPLPDMSLQYADYAAWQRGWLESGEIEKQLAYWREQLEGAPPLLELPTDYPRVAVQSYRGGMLRFQVQNPLAQALPVIGRAHDATLFMVLLAAFQVLLYRHSGQSDLCVGTPMANRTRTELEGLIGCFVNTLVLRTDFSGNPMFSQALARVRETCLGAQTRQDVPFEKLVEEFRPERNLSHHPLIQVMFVLQSVPEEPMHLPGIDIKPIPVETRTSPFDLTLTFTERADGLNGSIEYSADLFEEDTIVRLADRYLQILRRIAGDSRIRVDELPLLSEAEHRQLTEWNGRTPLRPDERELQGAFEAIAEHQPERIALVHGARRLSYGELNALADDLAIHLRTLGVGAEVHVGVCAERSVEAVVGILGTLKAGGTYVPLDPAHPAERIADLVEDSNAAILLTQKSLAARLPAGIEVLFLDEANWNPDRQASCTALTPEASALRSAYIIYTSGSTGKPKGVVVSHANAVASTDARFCFYPEPPEGFLLLSPFAFDSSVAGIFWTLSHGGRLFIPREGELLDPAALAACIKREGITHLLGLPSLYGLLLDQAPELSGSLRAAIVAGETCPPALVAMHRGRLPNTRLYNEYGPTEATVWTSVYDTDAADAASGKTISIGRPIAGATVYLLDARLDPVPIGVPGELYIGGNGVARGYHRRPDLTAERFIPDPFLESDAGRMYRTGDRARFRSDGTLEFLGRVDHQVKVRGFRIELEEIEARLRLHPHVKEALAVVREDRQGESRLVAYVVIAKAVPGTEEEGRPAVMELRQFLAIVLPDYMIPSVIVPLDALPLTPNGKPDRRALPAPDPAGQFAHRDAPPGTALEKQLTEIWQELLGVERVGIHDNFFDLGGHSLSAVQAIVRIQNRLGFDVSVAELFDAPTVSELARILAGRQTEEDGDVDALLRELEQLPEDERQRLLRELEV